ncbi:MAG TPA: Rab family GTPase [Thermoplasmata archaeon]|nr:Rab family GTPase [Thermoplasmata archaeon]
MPENVRMKAKVCLVGEGAVGKTSLVRRFVTDEFEDSYIQTLGSKVSKRRLQVPDADGEPVQVDLTLWDIMGQKAFRELLQEAYFDGAKGVLAVCDVTRQDTLFRLEEWIDAVTRVAGGVPVILLGNKADLGSSAQVKENDLKQFAASLDAAWTFTSAKTGENVEAAFETLAAAIANRELARQAA